MTRHTTRLAAIAAVLLSVVLAVCVSCVPQSPATTRRQLDAIDALEVEGVISEAQAIAFRELVGQAAQGFEWSDLLGTLGAAGSAIALAMLKRRGPAKPMSPEEITELRRQLHAQPAQAQP